MIKLISWNVRKVGEKIASRQKELTPAGERKLYPWIKFDLLSGIYSTLSVPTEKPRLLCGDFNTPQEETPDGKIITWGYSRRNGKYFLTPAGQYQHEVVHNIMHGLGEHCYLPDAYRRFHGYDACGADEAWSWQTHTGKRYRFDHIFASETRIAIFPDLTNSTVHSVENSPACIPILI